MRATVEAESDAGALDAVAVAATSPVARIGSVGVNRPVLKPRATAAEATVKSNE
jgi:hypothetical protein